VTDAEDQAVWQRWQSRRTPAANTRFLQDMSPLIDRAVAAYAPKSSQTARSHAKLLALQAANSYDPQRSSLNAHLMSQLRGLQRIAAKQAQPISVPERVLMEHKHVQQTAAELQDSLLRPATAVELADATGLSTKRIAYLRTYKPGLSESQVSTPLTAGDSEYEPAVRGNDRWMQRVHFLYDDADPTDQTILEHTYGLHGAPKLEMGEIARKVKLSGGAISQRTKRLQGKLDELEGVF